MDEGGTYKCSFSFDQKFSGSLNSVNLKNCVVIGLLMCLCSIQK